MAKILIVKINLKSNIHKTNTNKSEISKLIHKKINPITKYLRLVCVSDFRLIEPNHQYQIKRSTKTHNSRFQSTSICGFNMLTLSHHLLHPA